MPFAVVAHAWLVLAELLADHGTCQLYGAVGAADGDFTLVGVWIHLVAVTDLDGNLGILGSKQQQQQGEGVKVAG